MKKGKIKINLEGEKVVLFADADGLRYLSDVCLRVIGKNDPSGHFHLMVGMENIEKGSVGLDVVYRRTEEFPVE